MWLAFRNVSVFLALFVVANVFAQGIPEEQYSQEEARAKRLLNEAIEYYRSHGDDAMAAFSRQGRFVQDDLYVYVINTDGVMLASGGPSANLIGRDVGAALNDDLNKPLKEALSLPETGEMHAADYRWMNWSDGREERKRVLFQRLDDKVFSVGYYLPRSSEDEAKQFLDRVTAAVAQSPEETFVRINALDAEFQSDDLYAFVVDLDTERFVAHGYNLRLVRSDFRKIHSANEHPIGQQILEAVEINDEGTVSYVWPNPVTRKNEQKITMFRRVGHYIVLVGYYEGPR
ncbi:MAG: cache domain-containing protein [Pseudomonadales bacterium]